MKRILIIHTGGTISMLEDKETGVVSTTATHPLQRIGGMMAGIADVEEELVFHLPSPHITPSHMLELGRKVHERMATEHYDGVVITHGTDTLEETAYFLDLFLQTRKPLVVTGAMRSSNEIGSDGLYNLISSVRVAASGEAQEKGVLVVMNDEIHSARNVTKTSTSNVATFQSPQYGPIGIVTKEKVIFHQQLIGYESYPIQKLNNNVALIKAYAGMDPSLVQAIHQSNINGLVLEGLGQGNVPKEIVAPLKQMIQAGIPIVLVSRCYQGIVQPTYAYEGGGRDLKEMGVIFSNGLTGPKARIKLLIVLEMTNNLEELKRIFEM
ncbi:asparaginase [Aquibacillus sp. 3ASR75-11]|uniref:asparaginase n=1 Tax=Terrihalobacillus insolitus TaxID=2950438 RepID=A0A9X3WVG4_9BACI|nr:asparaginase [Terrihalobacillus insolitus]MDC3413074.1 asparaginase [Terrihalobacillus insolitus]MDC3424816.1 asparaginase [Terrihalobacillus insolitus]